MKYKLINRRIEIDRKQCFRNPVQIDISVEIFQIRKRNSRIAIIL